MAINDMIAAGFNAATIPMMETKGTMDRQTVTANKQKIDANAINNEIKRNEAMMGIIGYADTPEKLNQALSIAVNRGILPPERAREITPEVWLGGLRDQMMQQYLAANQSLTSQQRNFATYESLSDDPERQKDFMRMFRQTAEEAGDIAGAKATATSQSDLYWKPRIEAAQTAARIAAEERGDVFNEYSQIKASLPALEEVAGNLKRLAPLATYTLAGRTFDEAALQMGFGATRGATARTAYDMIIKNQVLPLLKQTFGAQFTVMEGEKLEATLGDINLSPEQKQAALEVWLQQAYRNMATKQRQIEEMDAAGINPQTPEPVVTPPATTQGMGGTPDEPELPAGFVPLGGN